MYKRSMAAVMSVLISVIIFTGCMETRVGVRLFDAGGEVMVKVLIDKEMFDSLAGDMSSLAGGFAGASIGDGNDLAGLTDDIIGGIGELQEGEVTFTSNLSVDSEAVNSFDNINTEIEGLPDVSDMEIVVENGREYYVETIVQSVSTYEEMCDVLVDMSLFENLFGTADMSEGYGGDDITIDGGDSAKGLFQSVTILRDETDTDFIYTFSGVTAAQESFNDMEGMDLSGMNLDEMFKYKFVLELPCEITDSKGGIASERVLTCDFASMSEPIEIFATGSIAKTDVVATVGEESTVGGESTDGGETETSGGSTTEAGFDDGDYTDNATVSAVTEDTTAISSVYEAEGTDTVVVEKQDNNASWLIIAVILSVLLLICLVVLVLVARKRAANKRSK